MAKLDNVKVIKEVAARIEYNGVTYVQSTDAAAVGDVLRIGEESCSYVTDGGFYEVTRIDGSGDPHFSDNDNDDCDADCLDEKPAVFKRVESRPARLTVGDYAKVIGGSGGHNYSMSSVIKIVVDDNTSVPYQGEKANGSKGNWISEKNVERATEAEFLAQKQPATSDVIVHDGKHYRKLTRKADVGELVVIIANNNGHGYKTGDIVKPKSRYDWGGKKVGIETGALNGMVRDTDYAVLVLVDSIREIKRKAAAGERIKIVEARVALGYATGDILTVNDSGPNTVHVTEPGVGSIWHSEYVVLEESTVVTPQPKRLSIGEYATVQRGAIGYISDYVGKLVKVTDVILTNGAPYTVATLEGELIGRAYESELVRATDEEVTQAQRSLRIPVGSHVKIAEGSIGAIRKHIGEIVVVSDNRTPYQVRTISGDDIGPAYDHEITQVSEEEVAEAAAKIERSKYAHGDKVRLISGGGDFPLYGFDNGSTYEVIDNDYDHAAGKRIKIVGGRSPQGFVTPGQIEKVSAEETKWAAIGRKVNEYKKGDVVNVRRTDYKGTGVVEDIALDSSAGSYVVGVRFTNGDYRGASREDAQLVTPVEQRFDRNEVAKPFAA